MSVQHLAMDVVKGGGSDPGHPQFVQLGYKCLSRVFCPQLPVRGGDTCVEETLAFRLCVRVCLLKC